MPVRAQCFAKEALVARPDQDPEHFDYDGDLVSLDPSGLDATYLRLASDDPGKMEETVEEKRELEHNLEQDDASLDES